MGSGTVTSIAAQAIELFLKAVTKSFWLTTAPLEVLIKNAAVSYTHLTLPTKA